MAVVMGGRGCSFCNFLEQMKDALKVEGSYNSLKQMIDTLKNIIKHPEIN